MAVTPRGLHVAKPRKKPQFLLLDRTIERIVNRANMPAGATEAQRRVMEGARSQLCCRAQLTRRMEEIYTLHFLMIEAEVREVSFG